MSEHTLELVKVKVDSARHKGKDIPLPSYDVLLDGEKIGQVRRAMITHERQTRGNRYVNARWQSPGWRYQVATSPTSWEAFSRTQGIERILAWRTEVNYAEAKNLAATVRTAR